MAKKKIQMTAYNGSSWDSIYPNVLDTNSTGKVVLSNGGQVTEAGDVGGTSAPIWLDDGEPKEITLTKNHTLIGGDNNKIETRAITLPGVITTSGRELNSQSSDLITEGAVYDALPKINGGKDFRNTDFYVPDMLTFVLPFGTDAFAAQTLTNAQISVVDKIFNNSYTINGLVNIKVSLMDGLGSSFRNTKILTLVNIDINAGGPPSDGHLDFKNDSPITIDGKRYACHLRITRKLYPSTVYSWNMVKTLWYEEEQDVKDTSVIKQFFLNEDSAQVSMGSDGISKLAVNTDWILSLSTSNKYPSKIVIETQGAADIFSCTTIFVRLTDLDFIYKHEQISSVSPTLATVTGYRSDKQTSSLYVSDYGAGSFLVTIYYMKKSDYVFIPSKLFIDPNAPGVTSYNGTVSYKSKLNGNLHFGGYYTYEPANMKFGKEGNLIALDAASDYENSTITFINDSNQAFVLPIDSSYDSDSYNIIPASSWRKAMVEYSTTGNGDQISYIWKTYIAA